MKSKLFLGLLAVAGYVGVSTLLSKVYAYQGDPNENGPNFKTTLRLFSSS